MRSTDFRKAAVLPLLLAALLALLCGPAAAWTSGDAAGAPNMLLAAMSGEGSLCAGSVLGDACADALAAATGADFAIVCGGELTGNLSPKPCSYADVCAVLADPDEPVAVAEVTTASLRAMLEQGVSRVRLDEKEAIDPEASAFGGFPQVSGFVFEYDASAAPGERILRLRAGGEKLALDDGQTLYTLAAPRSLFEGAWDYPAAACEDAGVTLAGALADFIAAGTPDDYAANDRVTAVGCTNYNLVNRFPLVICVVAAIAIWLGARLWKYKYANRFTR